MWEQTPERWVYVNSEDHQFSPLRVTFPFSDHKNAQHLRNRAHNGSSQALVFISSYCFKLFQLQFTLTVSKSCFTEHSISLFYSHQMWDVKSGVDTKEQAVFGSLHTWFAVCWCAPEFGKPLSHWLNETNSSSVKALFIFLWVQCSACIIKTCTTTTKANMTQHVRPLVIFTVKFNRNG